MRLKKFLSIILALTMVVPFSVITFAEKTGELYVSPDGNDSNNGSITSPLASIYEAKEKAKELDGNVTVYFREGTYTITETVNFNAEDKANVTFKAYNNEKVTFTAGTPITGFSECTVNGVNAFSKNIGKDADFNVLFNSEKTLSRTRYPESGYLFVESSDDANIINPDDEHYHRHFKGMYANTSDIPTLYNQSDVVVRVLHYWKDEYLQIKSYNSSNGYIEFNRPSSMETLEDDRYFLENVFEALNEPGEWYLDKTEGILYYIPQEGETTDNLTLWASETETMFSIDDVDGISFENINFRCNGFNQPEDGTIDFSQAAYDATPCLSYKNTSDFTVKNCEFKDIASCALFIGYNVQNAEINSCYFKNLGAQAVYVRGENLPIENENVTKNINIKNNIVDGYGKEFFNAVGVLVIHANTVNVENNEIHDGYYTAISVGWIWGYSYNVTYNNRICNNLLYNIGQGWLSDMGGIYTLGNQPGTVLSGNVIHNVAADPNQGGYGGWGIYLDEGSSYILVENNLVYSCGSDGYHLHYGSYNTIRNNIFAFNGDSQMRVVSNTSRVTPTDGGKITATIESNIILTDKKVPVLSYIQDKDYSDIKNNIVWDISNGEELYVLKNSDSNKATNLMTAQNRKYLTNSIIINPGFEDALNFNFNLTENSEAVKNGFTPFDYSDAGTLNGTVIGTSEQGGSTKYNNQSEFVDMTSSKEPLHSLIMFFMKILDFIKNLFN